MFEALDEFFSSLLFYFANIQIFWQIQNVHLQAIQNCHEDILQMDRPRKKIKTNIQKSIKDIFDPKSTNFFN